MTSRGLNGGNEGTLREQGSQRGSESGEEGKGGSGGDGYKERADGGHSEEGERKDERGVAGGREDPGGHKTEGDFSGEWHNSGLGSMLWHN